MRVAKLYRFGDIRIEDMPVPRIAPGEALIRTRACGICSGDVMPWYIEKKAPLVLGHEPAGEIVGLGKEPAGSSPFKVGDRVFVHHHAPCMGCRHCRRGDHVQCETWRAMGILPGGISEYIAVAANNLRNDTLLLNEEMSYEDGTLIEPVACVVKSFRRAAVKKGDTVLVIGLGVMGQIHILLAREFGAETVIGADMVPFRLGKARAFGADCVLDVSEEDLVEGVRAFTGGGMADIVVVGPNSAGAMELGMRAAARGGTVVFFTPAKPGERLDIDPNSLYFRDITVVMSYSCGPAETREALRLIAKGVVDAGRLVTHRFPIEKTAEAFQLTSQARDSLKSVIVF
ncbi:MAG: alcohol dehydrogenase catalytic domain-containing protein [Nitrospirae bacterium]|nr:alcohol dehydrogenase catalytic domain-containing protein [Nitrospirota bacterium]